jgi:peptide/nickel transport system permease protein
MLRLIARRLIFAIPLLFIVSFLSFFLVSLSPTDPARVIMGPYASDAEVEAKRLELHLDDSIFGQYWRWLKGALHGDLGSSIVGGGEVTRQLNARLEATLSLVIMSLGFVAILGVGLGIVSAVRGRFVGRVADGVSVVGLALPAFWIALLLTSFFSVRLGWFPVAGYSPIDAGVGGWARSLALPAIAASLAGVAVVSKQTRASMLEALSRDYVRVMEANGFSRRSIVYRHALRNASIPVVTVLGVFTVSLLGSAVVIENLFGYPGIGSLAASAAAQRDLPLIQGAVLYFTLIVILVGLLLDISYSLLDPRVRSK